MLGNEVWLISNDDRMALLVEDSLRRRGQPSSHQFNDINNTLVDLELRASLGTLPSVIIMDSKISNMGDAGIKTIREIKGSKIKDVKNIPIIVMMSDDESLANVVKSAGATAVVRRPSKEFTYKELDEVIEKIKSYVEVVLEYRSKYQGKESGGRGA